MRKKDAWVALHGFINNYTTTRQKNGSISPPPFSAFEKNRHTHKKARNLKAVFISNSLLKW